MKKELEQKLELEIEEKIPICVDLDGTLVPYDTAFQAWKFLLKKKPSLAIKVGFYYFFYGESRVKHLIGGLATRNDSLNCELLSYLKNAKKNNRRIILATGATLKTAKKFAEKYDIFDDIIASTEDFNCVGAHKMMKINELINDEKFMYVADHWYDWIIWQKATVLGVVNPKKIMLKFLKKSGKQVIVF